MFFNTSMHLLPAGGELYIKAIAQDSLSSQLHAGRILTFYSSLLNLLAKQAINKSFFHGYFRCRAMVHVFDFDVISSLSPAQYGPRRFFRQPAEIVWQTTGKETGEETMNSRKTRILSLDGRVARRVNQPAGNLSLPNC
jgi:hypothetical protein